jgi:nucleotide-binding universal stress UspA family protein
MAHVLIPTDLSGNALNAAVYAIRLYGDEGNVFTVLNCYMLPRGAASTMWSIDDMLAKESLEGTEAFVARLREALPGSKADLRVVCEHGDLPNVIARFKHDPDRPELVVMGTQGATGLKEVLMGSNTADVIRHSGFPVLAVPQDARYRTPKRIVLADDGGPLDKATITVLLNIARWSHSEVIIVRVVNEDSPAEGSQASADYDALLGAIPHSHHTISGENVITALHDMADQSDADLVVVVHRHRGLFEQLFHRSTATKLAMHTHIPMLVLRHGFIDG